MPPEMQVCLVTVLACLQMFKRFHTAYVDAVSNPFYTTSTVSMHQTLLLSCIISHSDMADAQFKPASHAVHTDTVH